MKLFAVWRIPVTERATTLANELAAGRAFKPVISTGKVSWAKALMSASDWGDDHLCLVGQSPGSPSAALFGEASAHSAETMGKADDEDDDE